MSCAGSPLYAAQLCGCVQRLNLTPSTTVPWLCFGKWTKVGA